VSIISYPRTESKRETQKECTKLSSRIDFLLSKHFLTDAELEELIGLIAHINWAHGALSYRLKAIKKAHELRNKVLRAQHEQYQKELEAYYKEQDALEEHRQAAFKKRLDTSVLDAQLSRLGENIAKHKHFIERSNRLKLEIQTATLLLTPSSDVRSFSEKLNQPLVNEPAFTPYDFKKVATCSNTVYFCDEGGEVLRNTYLEKVNVRQYERPKYNNRDEFISDDERSQLEKEVDNIITLSDDTERAIFDGWMKGEITQIDSEFHELQDFGKCIEVLDDLGVMFDTYDELGKRDLGKEMFHKYGYQKEHYPPYSCFTLRAKYKGESRGNVPLIPGLKNYNEKMALCFAIFDGQHIDVEHYKTTRASEKFMSELQADNKKATLGMWLDKAVEWNTEIFTERLEREATPPYDREKLAKQGRKAAVAIRNITKAHFVGLEGEAVLDLELENGKYRNNPVKKGK
jgi:hypothetical protein